MRPRARTLGLTAAAVVATTASPALADADSLVDHLGAQEIGIGEAMRAGAVGAVSARLNPAGLPLTNELVFDGGFGYRPADSASVVSLAACDSTNAAPGCFWYTYVGASPELGGMETDRRTHAGGVTLSRAISPRISLGAGVKYFDSETAGMDTGSGVNWDLGATVRLSDIINVAAVGYNLWGAESPDFPRAVGGGMMLRPLPSLTASFDAVWNLDADDGTGRYGGGLSYFFSGAGGQQGYPIRLGALHDVALDGTYVTGGLGFTTMKLAVDVGARRQVAGGDELLVIASLRLWGPRQARE